ncbi:hypothetical protein ANCCAN_20946 [Ancylostoma caninum]|uniref:Uncharacterized protein n=1 Tax=Ancylostoma caninum TaxID=29170 RepID=A0A368FLY3_ANCCA|nr:hypothetical protein ANCCAN_20946 [Ancylostoma caninum]
MRRAKAGMRAKTGMRAKAGMLDWGNDWKSQHAYEKRSCRLIHRRVDTSALGSPVLVLKLWKEMKRFGIIKTFVENVARITHECG